MLSRLDDIIYPNRCEVIDLASQRFFYPIFKNGSSSLYEYAQQHNCKILLNEQIKKIPIIDVVLRDPLQRFLSGFNTYVYTTKRDYPELDVNTIIYFAEKYLFLNRHYAPQLSWLINLFKYTNKNTKLRLHDMSAISKYTNISIKMEETNFLSNEIITRLKTNTHNEPYLKLDYSLLKLIGKEFTFSEIFKHLKYQEPFAYSKLKCIVLD